jgi:hypothetical protein
MVHCGPARPRLPRSAAPDQSNHGRCGKYPHPLAVAAADKAEPIVLDLIDPLRAGRHGAGVGRETRLSEAGGRRTGEVERHNTGFSTPTDARGRWSLGRQSPPTRGGLDLFGTHTQHSQYALKYRAKWRNLRAFGLRAMAAPPSAFRAARTARGASSADRARWMRLEKLPPPARHHRPESIPRFAISAHGRRSASHCATVWYTHSRAPA